MTGQTIAHYRIGDQIGEGSRAVVYRAIDVALGREVVIKFFTRSQAVSIVQFQNESRTISCLNHPNICTIYDTGEHEGRPYLVMEMLDGQTLSQVIGGQPLPAGRLIELGVQIAEALDAAHAEAIVHRDVKPANIVVTRAGRVKLLDFGVAIMRPRRLDPSTAQSLSLSSTGGTIPYMSPEQARVGDLDHRTDLFSLGIVLYEMAAGRRPFVGATAGEVLSAIVDQPAVSPRTLNPDVPVELERIITKALEKNPSLRYQTASDLRADLQRLKRDLDLASGAHRPPTVQHPPVSPRRQARLRVAAIAVGLVIAVGWLMLSAKLRPNTPSIAGTPISARGADIQLASEMLPVTRSVTTAPLSATPPVREAQEAPVQEPRTPMPPMRAPTPKVQPTSPDRPVAGIDHFAIARQQMALKLYDRAIDNLKTVAQDPQAKQAIDALFLIASIQGAQGASADAMSTYIEIASRFPDNSRAAEALGRLAEAMLKSKRHDKKQDARRTLTELVKRYPKSTWAPRALLMRSEIEASEGEYQRDDMFGGSIQTAAVTYREIVSEYPSSDEASAALNRLAHIYLDAKRFDIAAVTFEQLARRDDADRYDAWFSAGDIYDKRLKDDARARAAYARVTPLSPRYGEAQKRIRK